jgi:hypothetical protein
MNVTIELSAEQAAALKVQAEAQGLTVERWLEQLAAQFAPSTSITHLQTSAPEEWALRFHEWAESHDRTTPLLGENATSRESIYPDCFSPSPRRKRGVLAADILAASSGNRSMKRAGPLTRVESFVPLSQPGYSC